MVITFNNRQEFSSYLWTLPFKNLACLCTSYLRMTQLSIYKHIVKHADQGNTIFPSLLNKNFVYILFKTLKCGFLYDSLVLISQQQPTLDILLPSPSSVREKQFYLHMDQKQSKQNKANMPVTLLGYPRFLRRKNPLNGISKWKSKVTSVSKRIVP